MGGIPAASETRRMVLTSASKTVGASEVRDGAIEAWGCCRCCGRGSGSEGWEDDVGFKARLIADMVVGVGRWRRKGIGGFTLR